MMTSNTIDQSKRRLSQFYKMEEEAGPGPPPSGPDSQGPMNINSAMLMPASACPKFPDHSAFLLEKLNAQRYYGAFCDVIIRVEDCDFKLHKCVLAATSSKLQTLMYGVSGQSDLNNILSLKDVSLSGWKIIVDYIYSGVLRLDTFYAHDVLSTAHFLELHDIHRACLDFLREVHGDYQPRFDSNDMYRASSNSVNNSTALLSSHNYGFLSTDATFPLALGTQNSSLSGSISEGMGSTTHTEAGLPNNPQSTLQQQGSEQLQQQHQALNTDQSFSSVASLSSHQQHQQQSRTLVKEASTYRQRISGNSSQHAAEQGLMDESYTSSRSTVDSGNRVRLENGDRISSNHHEPKITSSNANTRAVLSSSQDQVSDNMSSLNSEPTQEKLLAQTNSGGMIDASRLDINHQTFAAMDQDFGNTNGMTGSLNNMQGMTNPEQVLPLNLHRVPNEQLVMGQTDKDLPLDQQSVLSEQTMPSSSNILPQTQAYGQGNQLMIGGNQHYPGHPHSMMSDGIPQDPQDTQVLRNPQSVESTNHHMIANPQSVESMADPQSLNVKTSNLDNGMPPTPQTLPAPQSVQPLTPASHHENPQTPTPRPGILTPTPPPLQQQNVFPAGANSNFVDNVGNYIEDYLKLIESLQGEPTGPTNQQLPNSNPADALDPMAMGNFMFKSQQDYSKSSLNQLIPVDMDPNFFPGLGSNPFQAPIPLPRSMPTNMNYVPVHDMLPGPPLQSNQRQNSDNQNLPTQVNLPSDPSQAPPSIRGPLLNSTPSTSNNPGIGASMGNSVEDVRKTILSVLSQERFDDDDDDPLSRSPDGNRMREHVPLTSLLNIATVGVVAGNNSGRQDHSNNTHPLDNPSGVMNAFSNRDTASNLFKGEQLALPAVTNQTFDMAVDHEFNTTDQAIDSDSDKEGNLVIAESDFEDHVVSNACGDGLDHHGLNASGNVAQTDMMLDACIQLPSNSGDKNSSQARIASFSQSQNLGNTAQLNYSQSSFPVTTTMAQAVDSSGHMSTSRGKFTVIKEYEDANRTNSGDVSLQDKADNFAKPLKKRLRLKLKLKRTDENEECELNTPNDNEISVLESASENEPVSRKKHLLDSSKSDTSLNLIFPITNTNSNDSTSNTQPEVVNEATVSHTPSPIEGMPKLDIQSALVDSVDESFFMVQSKKQKASKQQNLASFNSDSRNLNLQKDNSFDKSLPIITNEAPRLESEAPILAPAPMPFTVTDTCPPSLAPTLTTPISTNQPSANAVNTVEKTTVTVPPKKQKIKQPTKKVGKKKQAMERLMSEEKATAEQRNAKSNEMEKNPDDVDTSNLSESHLRKDNDHPVETTPSPTTNKENPGLAKGNTTTKDNKSAKSRKSHLSDVKSKGHKKKKASSNSEFPTSNIKAKNTKQHMKQSNSFNIKTSAKSSTPRKKSPGFNCDKCGRIFPKEDRLQFHLKQHRLNALHACHICGLKFGRPGELTRHLRQHSADTYTCRNCSAEFPNPTLYKAHCVKVHKEDKMFYCSHPGCTFDSDRLSVLEQHALVHSDLHCYNCEHCGKSFRQLNGLRSHQQSCKKLQSYECKFCKKKFNYMHGLKQHLLTHTDEKPVECPVCHVRVRDPRNLKRHMRTHDQSFPYACPYCPKKYRFSNSLKTHMNHHPDKIGPDSKSKSNRSAKSSSEKTPQGQTSASPSSSIQNLPQPVVERHVNSPEGSDMEQDVSEDQLELSPPPRPTGPPKLWDATAITVQSCEMSTPVKVKLEANLVKDLGYV